MESKFNLRRISLLLKYELVLLKQPLLIGALGIVAFILAISAMASTIQPRGVVEATTLETIYKLLFWFGGAVVASFSFHRISSKGGALNYLSLPASREEKFLVIFLSTALFYPLGMSLVFLLGESIASLGWMMTGGNFHFYVPFSEMSSTEFSYTMISFLSIQSFYFLGSILFKKYSFLKSTVGFFVLSFVIWIVGIVLFFVFVGEFDKNTQFSFMMDEQTIQEKLGYVAQLIGILFFVGLWVLSFLKFKKKEI